MIVPSVIRRKHSSLENVLQQLRQEVQETVQGFCDDHFGFAYSGRLKTLESLAEKIETGRYAKWTDLDDLFGCCVIIPSLNHEPECFEFLRNAFIEVNTRNRTASKKPPDVFRFEATRFVGRLRHIPPNDPNDPLFSTCFEVQVRTAFEHACSVTTHAIYK